ncbi:hypothetical protein JCM1840_005110 [Sporobolomyces johnsonii]
MGAFTDLFRPRSPSSKRSSAPLSTLDVQLDPPPKPLWAFATEPTLHHRQPHRHDRCRSHGPRDPYFHYDHPRSGTGQSPAGGAGATRTEGPPPEERENARQGAIDPRRRTTSMDDVARGFESIRISAPRGGPSYPPAPQPSSTRSSPARTLPRPPAQPHPYPASDLPQSYGASPWGGRPSASAPAGFAAPAQPQPAFQRTASSSPTRPTYPPAPSPPRPPLPLPPAMTMPQPQHYTTTPRGTLIPSNPPIPSTSPFHPFPSSSAPPPPPIYRAHPRPSPPRLPHPPPPPRHASSSASSSPNKPLPSPSQSPDRPKPPPRTRPSPASSSPVGGGPSQPPSRPRPRPLPSPASTSASARRKPPPKISTPLLTPSKPKQQPKSHVLDLSHTSSSSSSDDSGSELEPSLSSRSSSSIPTPPPARSTASTTTIKKSPAANARSRERPSPSPARSSPASSPSKPQQSQCHGITSAGRRCMRSALPAPLPAPDHDDEEAEPDGPDDQQPPAFCHQHAKLALVESGCFVLAGLSSWGGGGRREKWVSYSDWIMPDLPMQTQALLRHYMAKPVSDKDGEGYIYIHELVDRPPSSTSTTYLKLGRTIHPVLRLSQWRSSCPSREPIVRDILPRLPPSPSSSASDAPGSGSGSMQGHQLRFAERGTGYHHRWERLCLVEVAARASMHSRARGEPTSTSTPTEKEKCRDCGKRHLECFEVGKDAFEDPVDGGGGWVREIVERWERWCRDVLE